MKISYLFLFALLVSTGCGEKKDVQRKPEVTVASEPSAETKEKLPINLKTWLQFYQVENPGFSMNSFILSDSASINYGASSVKGNFEEDFNRIYEPFLVYSHDRSKYIDFDSYHWIADENGNPGFEADQQVTLVHLPSKTVRQISFFGPSFTIEEAYWEGDSSAVLLGNTYEKVPFYIRYNFNRNMKYTYRSTDTLRVNKSYTEERLKMNGVGGK